ncbi:hypothetical protein CAGGBEG34_30030 [Candidatus Glomeribacter gigasporarum BEG34]|uniref:Uncharacterized protein n=1 Tax=Candidatus Glomeribacter gigasporarum BEG34 TaxID=1070319 RepID=G2JBB4_9BURK|nr:hypothetical protein [Candidatus Glomeribacter gigasporarum]CCD30068.1 hypothetical protein CAGGBEG34_30030 [Candidatus Glomeribacter gigasporarum BEG34]
MPKSSDQVTAVLGQITPQLPKPTEISIEPYVDQLRQALQAQGLAQALAAQGRSDKTDWIVNRLKSILLFMERELGIVCKHDQHKKVFINTNITYVAQKTVGMVQTYRDAGTLSKVYEGALMDLSRAYVEDRLELYKAYEEEEGLKSKVDLFESVKNAFSTGLSKLSSNALFLKVLGGLVASAGQLGFELGKLSDQPTPSVPLGQLFTPPDWFLNAAFPRLTLCVQTHPHFIEAFQILKGYHDQLSTGIQEQYKNAKDYKGKSLNDMFGDITRIKSKDITHVDKLENRTLRTACQTRADTDGKWSNYMKCQVDRLLDRMAIRLLKYTFDQALKICQKRFQDTTTSLPEHFWPDYLRLNLASVPASCWSRLNLLQSLLRQIDPTRASASLTQQTPAQNPVSSNPIAFFGTVQPSSMQPSYESTTVHRQDPVWDPDVGSSKPRGP